MAHTAYETVLSECVSSEVISIIKRLECQLIQMRNEQFALAQLLAEAVDVNNRNEEELLKVKETMARISKYYTKLLSLRSTMASLNTHANQLQRRAETLKSIKLQYLSQIDDIRRTEQARDQAIAAKMSENTVSMATRSVSEATVARKATSEKAKSSTTTNAVPVSKLKKKKAKAREVKIADESWSRSPLRKSKSSMTN
ncbi:predicted protein [Lichtheimia corymbifera JMRC:FSU:9682]|uniref:Uncharacterized protein n=1 Tax=Lichtheimia corymbifera JMRC:FSU:9682 TaxID=1263082 RepID=A0A068SFU4_9FUNG|nr:predicted protein [Lichtheimia corymbifera JMRC:FSU:9682]